MKKLISEATDALNQYCIYAAVKYMFVPNNFPHLHSLPHLPGLFFPSIRWSQPSREKARVEVMQ